MATFRSVFTTNMIRGIRCYDPTFKPTAKELAKFNPTLWNFTSSNIYKEILSTIDKPPRMHSFYLPKYKIIKQWQAEASIDVGLPPWKRWPKAATLYRIIWYFLLVQLLIGNYKVWLVVRNGNFGLPAPELAYELP